ncbi:prephenate dehydratase [Desulfurivibrio dismutans]|uniref:prephenate dehydratase n=1 Tax=Desulfurivibrio dismutans TaxID=1398908 RepID=UPI0023DAB9B0|nr:prephenate dehydratase [Desulfurivibrio alkaliphilus]MDF1615280.1 prephenate dehydratase [Desulfurivibrio alkaliphilus]
MPQKKDHPSQEQALGSIRRQIDDIDDQLLTLLRRRIKLAQEVGKIKNVNNRDKWDPKREREIIRRLLQENAGEFPEPSLKAVLFEIIAACRLSQKPIEIAYLGPEATFSHLAGIVMFGSAASFRPMETIEDTFIEVERGRVEYGVVPVENSIEGAVTSTLDSFTRSQVKICGELNLPISHNLINQSGRLEDVKLVASHPQPLAQCRQWLQRNLPDTPRHNASSTGAAAAMAAADPQVGAIASSLAVKTYQLQVAVKGIEDYRGNTTRFLLIGSEPPKASGDDKTSLLVALLDRPGALHEALSTLAAHNINLTRIESRPFKDEPGRYLFFIDMLGHLDDHQVRESCEQLRQLCSHYQWLGSYPRSRE